VGYPSRRKLSLKGRLHTGRQNISGADGPWKASSAGGRLLFGRQTPSWKAGYLIEGRLPPEESCPRKTRNLPGRQASLLEVRMLPSWNAGYPMKANSWKAGYISLRDRLPLGRQAIFIETGYLIEGRLPPWKAGSLWQ
jgi:hypothetical protein